MRPLKTLLALALATISLGALAQAPPAPPIDGPRGGPRPLGPGPRGPELLLDPAVQRQLHLTKSQIARLRALRPVAPRPGSRPPMPPRPGTAAPIDEKIDAILSKAQRVQLRTIQARRGPGPDGGPRPSGPLPQPKHPAPKPQGEPERPRPSDPSPRR